MEPTSLGLWRWANRYAREKERAGQGTDYPTVRMAAKRFGCSQKVIQELADDSLPGKYLGLAYFNVEGEWPLGDCFVEAYDDSEPPPMIVA